MKLVIHDLSREEWDRIQGEYEGWTVVSDDGSIRPCTGCFGCWNRTPGTCVVRDGYENMGLLIHRAEEVLVISRYRYGGFSGFVKNVIDRCLGYVLPQFEIIGGETHHRKRYEETKPFTFIFRAPPLTKEEKACAGRYVRALCANFRGYVKAILFREESRELLPATVRPACTSGRTVLLVGSMRGLKGNSGKLAGKLAEFLTNEPEIVTIQRYIKNLNNLVSLLEDVETLVLCMPLYVDGVPSQMIRLMELFEQAYKGGSKKIYLLANMGLYESCQLQSLFAAVKQWCVKMGFSYCGGLGISAGELLGELMVHLPFRFGATKKAAEGMERLAEAVNSGSMLADIFAEPYAFPPALYIAIANLSWNRTAKANGLRPGDLLRRL